MKRHILCDPYYTVLPYCMMEPIIIGYPKHVRTWLTMLVTISFTVVCVLILIKLGAHQCYKIAMTVMVVYVTILILSVYSRACVQQSPLNQKHIALNSGAVTEKNLHTAVCSSLVAVTVIITVKRLMPKESILTDLLIAFVQPLDAVVRHKYVQKPLGNGQSQTQDNHRHKTITDSNGHKIYCHFKSKVGIRVFLTSTGNYIDFYAL